VKNTIIFDGSSTTFGAGTDSIYNSSHMTVDAIASQYPSRAFDVAPGGCIEEQTYFFQQTVVPLTKLPGYVQENEHIVVYHPGLGNSIQAGGQYTVTAQSGAVLTVSPAPGTAPLGSVTSSLFPGIHVRGTNNLADDYVVTAITTDTVTLNAAPTPSVMGSTIEIVSDTGQDAWQAIETYLTQAHDAGFKVVLIGSASRAPFDDEYYLASDIWLTQFRTAKALMAANWQAAGAAAYIDLETDPAFGADTAMNVVGVSGANVTVSALGSYTVVGNYVTWAGNDTAVTIKALSGNVLTLSVQPPTALTQLEDFNPAPWVNSTLWNLDGQHFTYAGYEKIAQLTATALVGAGLIP
jgi:hypothetical protein